jgi:hypothetical protein
MMFLLYCFIREVRNVIFSAAELLMSITISRRLFDCTFHVLFDAMFMFHIFVTFIVINYMLYMLWLGDIICKSVCPHQSTTRGSTAQYIESDPISPGPRYFYLVAFLGMAFSYQTLSLGICDPVGSWFLAWVLRTLRYVTYTE